MESQIISNRYIRLNQLHTLLKRLFVAGYEVDVRTIQSFLYINKDLLYYSPDLILTLFQERAEHYHLSIPRKLTEGWLS